MHRIWQNLKFGVYKISPCFGAVLRPRVGLILVPKNAFHPSRDRFSGGDRERLLEKHGFIYPYFVDLFAPVGAAKNFCEMGNVEC
jgi:hypothetical protein